MSRFTLPKRNVRCKAMTLENLPCKEFALGIGDYCSKHGGAKLVRYDCERTKRLRGLEDEKNQILKEIGEERAKAKSKNRRPKTR